MLFARSGNTAGVFPSAHGVGVAIYLRAGEKRSLPWACRRVSRLRRCARFARASPALEL